MKNCLNEVLKACIELAHSGESNINVFDLMYETNLAYPELKEIIDKLVLNNELEVIDIKSYKFIGDVNRRFKEVENKKSDLPISDKSPRQNDPFAERRAYLEERRQELIARMQAEEMKSNCEEVLYHEPEEDNEDEELDEKFAEYEKFLRGELDGLDETEDGEESGQEGLIEFLKEILREGRINKPWEEIPEHPSWDNDNDFMRFCAEKLMEIANSDKKTGRQGALKKAKVILEEARKLQSKKMIEVYECIVFELQNMSNYYYIKIRDGLL